MTLAYYDGMRGLVPCKVFAAAIDGESVTLRAKVTARRYPYSKGDMLTFGERWIIPRDAVKRFRGNAFPVILSYSWRDILCHGGAPRIVHRDVMEWLTK